MALEGLHGVRNWGGILASRRESVLGSAASSEKILYLKVCVIIGVSFRQAKFRKMKNKKRIFL